MGSAGYRPNSVQPDAVIQALRYLYALVPCLCNLIAIGIIWDFPLDAQKHGDIRAAIKARRRGLAPLDPLRPGRRITTDLASPPAT